MEVDAKLLLELLLGAVLLFALLSAKRLASFARRKFVLRRVPKAPESVPVLGHALTLMRNVPWDKFCEWKSKCGPVVRVNIMQKEHPTKK